MFDVISFCHLPHIFLFACALFCLACSIVLFNAGKEKVSIITLFLCAALVRLFMALQDPFLHLWDEQFHALVARNFMDNPLLPVLKKYTVTGYDPIYWTNTHFWVHKQPLFMWQMALSLKLFGVSAASLRLPSVLMGAITVPLLYSIAKSLTGDKLTAYYAAIILCFCKYQLEMISGAKGMDHNDVAYYFYVLASIWAYTKYLRHKTISNIILIGVFVGCAVLNKWLLGILVYAGWGVNFLINTENGQRKKEIQHILLSFAVSATIFLPWQIYIYHTFPFEASVEGKLNLQHITEVVEGHGGTIFYYINNFPAYFGEVGWFLVPAGFVVLLLKTHNKSIYNRQIGIGLLTMFSIIFIFFSYIVKTKIDSFFFVAAPIGIILIAMAIKEVRQRIWQAQRVIAARITSSVFVLAIVISIFNPDDIRTTHDPNNEARIARSANTLFYKNLKSHIPSKAKIILDITPDEEFEAMFYNNDCMIYPHLLGMDIMDSLRKINTPVAIYGRHPDSVLLNIAASYPNVVIINENTFSNKKIN